MLIFNNFSKNTKNNKKYVFTHTNTSLPWAGRDTKSIFKQSKASLNSEFSFS